MFMKGQFRTNGGGEDKQKVRRAEPLNKTQALQKGGALNSWGRKVREMHIYGGKGNDHQGTGSVGVEV